MDAQEFVGRQYVGDNWLELVKHLARQQGDGVMFTCEGLITSVDQKKYMAKVMLMPYQVETGWLPIGAVAAGPGWGLCHVPLDNTEVTVDFIGGSPHNGRVRFCYFNDVDAPPDDLEPGDFLLKHSSGTMLRFDKEGRGTLTTSQDLEVNVGGDLIAAVEGDASVTATGDVTISAATINLDGPVTVSGGSVTIGNETSIDGRQFLAHTHEGVQSGPGVTGPVV